MANAFQPQTGWGRFGLQVGGAAGLMAAVLLLALVAAPPLAELPAWQRVAWVALMCSAGLATYVAGALVLGLRPRHLQAPKAV